MKRFLTRFVIPAALIGAGAFGAKMLVDSKQTAEPDPVADAPPPVEVGVAHKTMHVPRVRATGVVEAARTLRVQPQVAGTLTYVAPELVTGGKVEEGQTLARIDRRDYSLVVKREEAALAQAQVEVELERGRGRSAQREWDRFGDGSSQGRLAKREPQLAAAEANVAARLVAIESAKLNLTRTTIRAPFNAAVTQESAEKGQVVAQGTSLATLVGTDEVWIRVAVPPDSLKHVHYADTEGNGASVVDVMQSLGRGAKASWEGRALRLISELDTDSRSAQVLVSVAKPLEVNPEMPLLPGAFVSVEINAGSPRPAIEVPRLAVFDGDRVWRVNVESKLEEVTVEIGWANDDAVFVTRGLDEGDRFVLREPPRAIPGMRVDASGAADDGPEGAGTESAEPVATDGDPASAGAREGKAQP